MTFDKETVQQICRDIANKCSTPQEFERKVRSENLGIAAVVTYCGRMYMGSALFFDKSHKCCSVNF